MRILGIDSSTPGCSVALLNDDTVVAERIAVPRPTHSKFLLQMVPDIKIILGKFHDLKRSSLDIRNEKVTIFKIIFSLFYKLVIWTNLEENRNFKVKRYNYSYKL